MIIGTKIDGHKDMSKHNELLVYNKPKTVYIPLICGNVTDVKILVKENDYVFKGQEIAERKGSFSLPINSSVSGKVIGFQDKTVYNGKQVKCVVIENDLKETYKESDKEKDKIYEYSKEEFINKLKQGGIRGLGGADFPTYVKYSTEEKIKNLIINAVECEPYITADFTVMKNHYEEILECIDAIMTINNIDNGYIAVKKNNTEVIDLINTVIGTYPKISLVEVPNLYPMGWEKNIIKYILKKDYNKLPIELNTVVNNVSTIYSIYELLKYHRPLTNRIVTITGEMVKKPTNVEVKIGTNINEVLSILGIKKGKKLFVAGGPMMGTNIPDGDLIVTSNLNNILVLDKTDDSIETMCLRCGKCANACPAGLSPVMIKDNINKIQTLQKLEINRCIECGLCSYICPAKIMVREYVREAKAKLRGK